MEAEKKTEEKATSKVNGFDPGLVKKILLIISIFVIISSPVVAYLIRRSAENAYLEEREESYYAVFLTNGQVYFGHLFYENTDTPILTEIYYLQASTTGTGGDATSNYTLVKLGKELHGPEDQMVLNLAHVMFWEELSGDSKVLAAIKDYESGGQLTVPQDQAEPYIEESTGAVEDEDKEEDADVTDKTTDTEDDDTGTGDTTEDGTDDTTGTDRDQSTVTQ